MIDVIEVRSILIQSCQCISTNDYGHGLRPFQVVKAVFHGDDGTHVVLDVDLVDQDQCSLRLVQSSVHASHIRARQRCGLAVRHREDDLAVRCRFHTDLVREQTDVSELQVQLTARTRQHGRITRLDPGNLVRIVAGVDVDRSPEAAYGDDGRQGQIE